MSFQYIHTSSKRGLEPGKSGFCCVARDKDIPPDLISELESQSRYTSDSRGGHPLILRHRIARLRSGTYHILCRIHDSGTDYSKRNNHLAHHIAFYQSEVTSLPNPAAILLNWRGWRKDWDEPPRTLEAFEAFDIQDIESFWAVQNQATPFPKVVQDKRSSSYVFNITLQQERQLIEHIRRGINDLPASQRWSHSFTSCLLPTDKPQDYDWAGMIERLPLPYEVDTKPRPLEPTPLAEPKPESAPAPKKAGTKKKEKPIPAPAKRSDSSIHVEIPKEYSRRQLRKRVKRPIGNREFSRYVNWAIAAVAFICAVLLYSFLRTREASPISSFSPTAEESRNHNLGSREEAWLTFKTAGYPRAELPAIRPTAEFLDSAGEDAPLQVVRFLESIGQASLDIRDGFLNVPDSLIQKEGNRSYRIPVSPVGYPAVKQLALVPASLQDALASLCDTSPGATIGPLATLTPAIYSPELLASSIERFLTHAAASQDPLPESTAQALSSYQAQRASILGNPQFQPILEIHEAFESPGHIPYLSFDESGLLVPGAPMSLLQYLRELFLKKVSQSNDPALQTTLFQTYANRVRHASSNSASETASLIQEALDALELSGRSPTDTWRTIKQQWRNCFVREDLMEQTILGYTLESLESAKLELAETRSQFSHSDLTQQQLAKTRREHANEVLQIARSRIQPKEWIVIPAQTTKVAHSRP